MGGKENFDNVRTRNYQVQLECGRTRQTRGTGEQDPGLPGFGVHLGEHSSNPGGKGKGRERVPDAWDTGEMGPRPAIQGLHMSNGRGKGTVGGGECKKESGDVCFHYHV